MIQPVDRTLRTHEQSKLSQIGGLAMKGDVQMINLKYFLRQASRRFGMRYEEAAGMLAGLHNCVGLPSEVLEEIRYELNQVLAVVNDETISKGTFERLLSDDLPRVTDTVVPAVPLLYISSLTLA